MEQVKTIQSTDSINAMLSQDLIKEKENHKHTIVKGALALSSMGMANGLMASASNSLSIGDGDDETIPDNGADAIQELINKAYNMQISYDSTSVMDFLNYVIALKKNIKKFSQADQDSINSILGNMLNSGSESLADKLAVFIRDAAFFNDGSASSGQSALDAMQKMLDKISGLSSSKGDFFDQLTQSLQYYSSTIPMRTFLKNYADKDGVPIFDSDLGSYIYEGDLNSFLYEAKFSDWVQKCRSSEISDLFKSTKNFYLLILLLFTVCGGYSTDLQYQVGGQGKLADNMRGFGTDASKLIDELEKFAPDTVGGKGKWTPDDAKAWLQKMNNIMFKVGSFQKLYGSLPTQLKEAFDAIYQVSGTTDDGQTHTLQDCIDKMSDPNASPDDKAQASKWASEILNGIYPTDPKTIPTSYQTITNNLKQVTDSCTNQSQVVGTQTEQVTNKINTDTAFIKQMGDSWNAILTAITKNEKAG